MHITKIAIQRPVTTLMVSLGLIFLGIVSWKELPVQRLPDITFPAMYYGARSREADLSPEKTNDELTRPFEKMVASLPGVKKTYSSTGAGTFWGYAEFEQGTDMRFRVIELQEKVNKWVSGRTDKVETMIVPYSTDEMSGRLMEMILLVPVGEEYRTSTCGDLIRRKIRSVDGVSQVEVEGEMIPHLTLETERDEMVSRGLDVQNLINAVNRYSQDRIWLGALKEGRKAHDIQIISKIESLDDLLKVAVDDKALYPLESLVAPMREAEQSKNVFRYNGKKAVNVRISREKDRNTLQLAKIVRQRIEEINKELPPGFELRIVHDEAEILEKLIKNIANLAATGALLAMFVLLVFVRSVRIALVVVISIPASLLITFNAMYAAGLSINIISLLGLAAGVGMLVDNSIVVVENVFRHYQKRKPPKEAAWLGSREVARAILVSTATNLVVFVPLFYVDEVIVLIMKEMALSLIFPMVVSLFIAVTLVPMLASKVIEMSSRRRFASPGDREGTRRDTPTFGKRIVPAGSFWAKWNPWQKPGNPPRNFLKEYVFFFTKASLRHPIKLFFIFLFALSFTIIAATLKMAIQRMRQSQKTETVSLYGKTPIGSRLEDADRFFLEKEKQVTLEMKKSDVIKSFSTRFSKEGGEIVLQISEKYQDLPEWDFQFSFRQLRSGDQNTGFRFQPFPELYSDMMIQRGGRGRSSYREAVLVTGENMDAMLSAGETVRKFLQSEPEVGEMGIEMPLGDPEVYFNPDLELFMVMKADARSLGSFFRSREKRGIETSLKLREKDVERMVTVRVKSKEEEEEEEVTQTLSELKRTMIPLQGGGMAPLDNLGSFSIVHSVPHITKENRQRNLRVGFNLKPTYDKPGMEKAREDLLKDIQKKLNSLRLPLGVSAALSGTLEEARTSHMTWRKLLFWAILAVYLTMAFFFGSLTLPLVILVTLPLAALGGVWGIVLFRARLDEVAMLGSIILAGLAVNNGILLIEYTRQLEKFERFRRSRALLYAVAYRLRPILMTSLTTVLGLLPILLSRDAANEARSLVSVLVGGMLASTFLALVFVPSFYNVMSLAMEKIRALKARGLKAFERVYPPIPDLAILAVPAPQLAAETVGYTPQQSTDTGIIEPVETKWEPRTIHNSQFTMNRQLHISVKNISKVYPLFHFKKIFGFIPPRDYPFGHKPPSGAVALKNVSLEIESGMFGLLGPNGAGKTTLMKILTGIVEPTYGVAEVMGYDLRYYSEEIRKYISYLPQNFGVYESLTLDKYLNFFAPFYGLNDPRERKKKIDEVVELVGLAHDRDRPMKNYSGGMKQRAGVAQFFLSMRPVVIVDEPTAGLDPLERVRFRLILSELARTRIVILSTHIVEDITSSCNRIAVLNRGEVLYHGDLEGVHRAGEGMIWDLVRPAGEDVPIPRRQILFRRYIGDQVLYHYVSEQPLPGSVSVPAGFEDAYVALLLKHNADGALMPKPL